VSAALLPTEVIRAKRDGGTLSRAQIDAFVGGLVDGSWSDSQAAAMAMAILLRGMQSEETAALADAMTHSGTALNWRSAQAAGQLHGPVLDKHSTGGVGDKVSLMLAPMLAACGAIVPMVSGRGLGHTGGTLDKLEALPGYTVLQPHATLLRTLQTAGCAIVGAGGSVAPADRRLYAIRDVTATVESVPLITASILSKKRAAGLQALVMDVKFGSGAFTADPAHALELARSLVRVATAAGLPTVALLSDMDQVLGTTAGNALEVQEAIDFLAGRGPREPRQLELTLALGAHVLQLAGVAASLADAQALLQRSLDSGDAAERFARMVAALGGPSDVLHDATLATAPVQRPVPAPRSGCIARMDTRAVGLAVLALGAGRVRPGDAVDPRVGIAGVRPLGTHVQAGEPLATVHAASGAAADAAIAALQAAITLADDAPARGPVVHRVVTAADAA
jgi:thymidine phosphorylase